MTSVLSHSWLGRSSGQGVPLDAYALNLTASLQSLVMRWSLTCSTNRHTKALVPVVV